MPGQLVLASCSVDRWLANRFEIEVTSQGAGYQLVSSMSQLRLYGTKRPLKLALRGCIRAVEGLAHISLVERGDRESCLRCRECLIRGAGGAGDLELRDWAAF